MSLEKPDLAKMKVAELREMAEKIGIASPSKKTKAQLVKAIAGKQKGEPAKVSSRKPEVSAIPIEKTHGIFVNYRTGMFRQSNHDVLVRIRQATDANTASRYIGRKAVWQSQTGKKLVGKIVSTHGKGGILLTRFRKGLPGQAIGATVEII